MANFSFSANGKHEYCCTVVRLKEITPIENSDFLATTIVNGLSIVVRKDECREGDIMIYASNESALNKEFLKANSLFSDAELNANPEKKGFFNKHGRIRLIKLRGTYSYGFLFSPCDLLRWKPKMNLRNIESLVGQDFDTIDDELFIKAYIPETAPRQKHVKANNRLKLFDRIVPETFSFHYDTTQLAGQIDRVDPKAKVCVSVKLHGTSAIFANIPVKTPLKLNIFQKLFYWITKKSMYSVDFDLVYSSRKVIKNQYINEKSESYFSIDLWKDVSDKIKAYIPKGYTIYGEIVGYETGLNKFIQTDYDYGCMPGEWKLMIYRISSCTYNGFNPGDAREWNVGEVYEWTENLIKEHPDLKNYIQSISIIYQGTLEERYKTTDSALILQKMKEDFGLEKQEPLCKCKVPREGIVLRVDNDPLKEAFKLKSNKFMERESAQIDKGEIDIELQENI